MNHNSAEDETAKKRIACDYISGNDRRLCRQNLLEIKRKRSQLSDKHNLGPFIKHLLDFSP